MTAARFVHVTRGCRNPPELTFRIEYRSESAYPWWVHLERRGRWDAVQDAGGGAGVLQRNEYPEGNVMAEFVKGDRVRRTSHAFYGGPQVGSLGTVEGHDHFSGERAFLVRWDAFPGEPSYWTATRLELHGPASSSSQQQPVAAVKVCGSECAKIRDELQKQVKLTEDWRMLAGDWEKLAEARGCAIGDARGERDSWRQRCERAERALDLALKRGRR